MSLGGPDQGRGDRAIKGGEREKRGEWTNLSPELMERKISRSGAGSEQKKKSRKCFKKIKSNFVESSRFQFVSWVQAEEIFPKDSVELMKGWKVNWANPSHCFPLPPPIFGLNSQPLFFH